MSCFTPASVVAGHQLAQPVLAGGAEQHRHGLTIAKALRIGLRSDFKAAHVWRQKQHPRPMRLRRLNAGRALPAHAHRPPKPEPRQLGHQLAGLTDR